MADSQYHGFPALIAALALTLSTLTATAQTKVKFFSRFPNDRLRSAFY